MEKRNDLWILGLTAFTLAGLSLAHSVDKEKAAAATVQAEKALEGNPQMTMPVTKEEKIKNMEAEKKAEKKGMRAERKAEKKEMRAEKKADKKAMEAKKAADKKDMKAKKAADKKDMEAVKVMK